MKDVCMQQAFAVEKNQPQKPLEGELASVVNIIKTLVTKGIADNQAISPVIFMGKFGDREIKAVTDAFQDPSRMEEAQEALIEAVNKLGLNFVILTAVAAVQAVPGEEAIEKMRKGLRPFSSDAAKEDKLVIFVQTPTKNYLSLTSTDDFMSKEQQENPLLFMEVPDNLTFGGMVNIFPKNDFN